MSINIFIKRMMVELPLSMNKYTRCNRVLIYIKGMMNFLSMRCREYRIMYRLEEEVEE